jgi:hypothetical protein
VRFRIPNAGKAGFKIPNSKFKMDSMTRNRPLSAVLCLLFSAFCSLLTPIFSLFSAYCLLLAAYCCRLTAYGLFGSFGLFGAAFGRIPNSKFNIQY